MARALIVGCGCRGRELGTALLGTGWQVRGTSREGAHAAAIEAAGIEPANADPDRVATVLDHVIDVTIVYWLLGAALPAETAAALNGPRLERFLEEIVDTPVRGVVYELGRGDAAAPGRRGVRILGAAGRRWRIPFEVVEGPGAEEWDGWRKRMLAAAAHLIEVG